MLSMLGTITTCMTLLYLLNICFPIYFPLPLLFFFTSQCVIGLKFVTVKVAAVSLAGREGRSERGKRYVRPGMQL